MYRAFSAITLICSALLLVAFCAPASAEYVPPPTLGELLGADCVATGRFIRKDGALRFVPIQVLRGQESTIEDLLQAKRLDVRGDGDGKLTFLSHEANILGLYRRDASLPALWFFSRGWRSLVMQPIELVPGFTALLRGKSVAGRLAQRLSIDLWSESDPGALFRLLQGLDFDMRREALEELFAKRDKRLVAELHEIALRVDSHAAGNAVDVLIETRLLEAERFWDQWLAHPSAYVLQPILEAHDVDRVTNDVRKAIAKEKRPAWLAGLLQRVPNTRPAYVDINIQHLDHLEPQVRGRALGSLHDYFWTLASGKKGGDARSDMDALGKRLLPLLQRRLKVEKDEPTRKTLAKMLAEQDGVPWVLRGPAAVVPEPLPAYSDGEELKFLVNRLTSHSDRGFISESAGREIAERFFDDGFQQLKVAAVSPGANRASVFEGMGYVRHPRVFEFLVQHARTVALGDSTFAATLEAIGRQNDTRSFDVVADLIKGRLQGKVDLDAVYHALAHIQDQRAFDLLKDLKSSATYHGKVPYLRARAVHGDAWAIEELITAFDNPSRAGFLDKGYYNEQTLADVLVWIDTPHVTKRLKRYVEATWPSRTEWHSTGALSAGMENYAGAARRSKPIGEVGRRDPHWLGEFALKQMAAPTLAARAYGLAVFRELTGRSFDYRPEAFAAERATPLHKLQAWWAEHKRQSRRDWLLSYFREKGFPMTLLHAPESLPVLMRALESDFFTHHLAVEQISVITRKYFTHFHAQESYRGQEQMTIRVGGWLRARQLLPAAKP